MGIELAESQTSQHVKHRDLYLDSNKHKVYTEVFSVHIYLSLIYGNCFFLWSLPYPLSLNRDLFNMLACLTLVSFFTFFSDLYSHVLIFLIIFALPRVVMSDRSSHSIRS